MTGITKRSLVINGHGTSLSLEPLFWHALADLAKREHTSIPGLVARIDLARGEADNLSSAVRVAVLTDALRRANSASPDTDAR